MSGRFAVALVSTSAALTVCLLLASRERATAETGSEVAKREDGAATAADGRANGWPVREDVAFDPGQPATRAGARTLELVLRIEAHMTKTRYQHNTVVRERQGHYLWDCSGMAEWILDRSAHRSRARISRERPVARDFAAAIERAPVDRPRGGWSRVGHIDDVRPGDVFAWRRPASLGPGITGHVGFVMERARPMRRMEGAYTMRIADATSLPHQEDTRARGGDGGFGFGTLLFLTGGDGEVDSYGWFGTDSRGVIVTPVVFGRLH